MPSTPHIGESCPSGPVFVPEGFRRRPDTSTNDGRKLIYYAGEKGGQLYNLKNDPKETRNLYNLSEYSTGQGELITELLDKLILEADREPVIMNLQCDGKYSNHVMTREVWGEELNPT